MSDRDKIIQDILEHMKKYGGDNSDWYVGITSSPGDRLFGDHKVDVKKDIWISIKANSEDMARNAEAYFIDDIGTHGDKGGGQYPYYVYAYKMTENTIE